MLNRGEWLSAGLGQQRPKCNRRPAVKILNSQKKIPGPNGEGHVTPPPSFLIEFPGLITPRVTSYAPTGPYHARFLNRLTDHTFCID
jgi:hypothetical protein